MSNMCFNMQVTFNRWNFASLDSSFRKFYSRVDELYIYIVYIIVKSFCLFRCLTVFFLLPFLIAIDRPPVKISVIGRPILLALEDVDGSPSFLEKALQFIEEYGGVSLLFVIAHCSD